MQDFKQLKVWEKSHRLTLDVYRATADFPKEEMYGLTSQIRRAAGSILDFVYLDEASINNQTHRKELRK